MDSLGPSSVVFQCRNTAPALHDVTEDYLTVYTLLQLIRFTHTHTYTFMYIYNYNCIYTYMCMYIYISIYLCVYMKKTVHLYQSLSLITSNCDGSTCQSKPADQQCLGRWTPNEWMTETMVLTCSPLSGALCHVMEQSGNSRRSCAICLKKVYPGAIVSYIDNYMRI